MIDQIRDPSAEDAKPTISPPSPVAMAVSFGEAVERIKDAIGRTADRIHFMPSYGESKYSPPSLRYTVVIELDNEKIDITSCSFEGLICDIKARRLTMYEQMERMKIELEEHHRESRHEAEAGCHE